jgi:hypothetical protein
VILLDDVALARLDWDQDDPIEMRRTPRDAARSIRGSLHLPQYDGDERAWTWIDYGDAQSAAYRRILEASEEEINQLPDV